MRNTFISLGTAFFLAGTAQAAEQRAMIEVNGLWCPSCTYIVGEAFRESASVEIIEFVGDDSGLSGVFTITFDDTLDDIAEIVQRPANYGYPANLLEDAPKS